MFLGLIVQVSGTGIAAGDLSDAYVHKLSKAIYIAEGGKSAKKPFGILSVKCEGYEECGRVCRNTIRNNYRRWQDSDMDEDFISFLGERYAPRNSHPLNKNWVPNVKKIMLTLGNK